VSICWTIARPHTEVLHIDVFDTCRRRPRDVAAAFRRLLFRFGSSVTSGAR
jgi:hypothetical protein